MVLSRSLLGIWSPHVHRRMRLWPWRDLRPGQLCPSDGELLGHGSIGVCSDINPDREP